MVKRVLFFQPNKTAFDILRYLREQVCTALEGLGVECRVFDFNEGSFSDLRNLLDAFKPEVTATINGIDPLADGKMLSDHLKIPHLYLLTEGPTHYLDTTRSPLSIPAHPDRFSCFVLGLFGNHQTICSPHGANPALKRDVAAERPRDLVYFGQCKRSTATRKEWGEKYLDHMIQIFNSVIERSYHSTTTSHLELFLEAWQQEKMDPRRYSFSAIANEMESVCAGEAQVALLRSLSGLKIDIFTPEERHEAWKGALEGCEGISLHPAVPYVEALEIMKESKVVLNSAPLFKDGANLDLFSAMACGAVAVTNRNTYTQSHFADGEHCLLYTPDTLGDLKGRLEPLLQNDQARQTIAGKGQECVLTHHTWEQRMKYLTKELEWILHHLHSFARLPDTWSKV